MDWIDFKFETSHYPIQWMLTASVIILILLLKWLIRKRLNQILIRHEYEVHRAVLTRRILYFGIYLAAAIAIVTIWGANAKDIWIYFSSILGVIAVGFFATWSILSNIIAGIFIYTSNPFRISSRIKLLDPELTATVKDIGLLYTQLEDVEGTIQVPNSIFFQQTFKVLKS
ncbi:MAG: mechanosensitive ion channel family protein [Cyclobacteriaceae bacterium]|nr:mechanosensitive ion channel family protein [Cyclobacteriaceae bacterium]